MKLLQQPVQTVNLQQLQAALLKRVNQKVAVYWSGKVEEGVVPLEEKQRGPIDHVRHEEHLADLRLFELQHFINIVDQLNGSIVHYVGTGDGRVLHDLAVYLNSRGKRIWAYDIGKAGVQKTQLAFSDAGTEEQNVVLQADIESVCTEEIMLPDSSCLLALPRILDILDKQEPNYQSLAPEQRKMARVCRMIGPLLKFLKVFVIIREPLRNINAIWGDTTPSPLESVARYMSEGLGVEVEIIRLGFHQHYHHVNTAALLQAKF